MIEEANTAVVVPSYARPERLRACLDSLAEQDGGPYPTVVVDDGSPEPLANLCAAYPWVTYLRQANAGPAAARNAGAHAAKAAGASFLCFTDDDCRPRPGWVRALRQAQNSQPDRLVGGRVENALVHNDYAAASQSMCDYIYDYFGATAGEVPFFTSNNIGCSTAGFAEIGGFDESFPLAAGEDRDFGRRWRENLGPLVYAPEAIVDHAHALTLMRFWRQHANYGRGARRLRRRVSDHSSERRGLEPAGFYAGLVTHPLRDGSLGARDRFVRTALMGFSQVATAVGYLTEIRAERG